MKKYEFVPGDEITIAPGLTVKRIRALVAIDAFGVSPGNVGGYVETEANLSQVSGDAWVSGNAHVYGNARHLLIIGPIGSRNAMLTVHADKKVGIRYTTGCFSGSRDDFLAAINSTHGCSPHGNAYTAAVILADHLIDAP